MRLWKRNAGRPDLLRAGIRRYAYPRLCLPDLSPRIAAYRLGCRSVRSGGERFKPRHVVDCLGPFALHSRAIRLQHLKVPYAAVADWLRDRLAKPA